VGDGTGVGNQIELAYLGVPWIEFPSASCPCLILPVLVPHSSGFPRRSMEERESEAPAGQLPPSALAILIISPEGLCNWSISPLLFKLPE